MVGCKPSSDTAHQQARSIFCKIAPGEKILVLHITRQLGGDRKLRSGWVSSTQFWINRYKQVSEKIRRAVDYKAS
jgi:hypothetical protein